MCFRPGTRVTCRTLVLRRRTSRAGWRVWCSLLPPLGRSSVVGAALAALGILASIWTDSTVAASAFVALAAFGVQLQLPSWWASATQVSGRHLGALFGMMNMMGMFGRILFNLFVGGFADWRKSLGYSGRAQWDPALYAYVAVAVIGAVLWSLVNPEKT